MVQALKSTTALITSVLIAALMTSCGGKDSHEKIMEGALGLMEDVVAIMEDVKDKDSADTAAKKLDGLVGKFEKLADRSDAIGKPDEATEKALEEKFEKRGEELAQKMMTTMLAVATKDPTIMKPLEGPMERIGKAMDKVK